ncbi:MAG: SRPBCC family protein [Leptospira sp.]|nr:SRPBCC family protein [Leptospira sp.]
MNPSNPLQLRTPSDKEIYWTREFHAPNKLVFDSMTKPDLIRRWLLGPEGWSMPVCKVDLRVRGRYRYVWSHPERGEMGVGGVFKEINAPTKLVNTERFDQSWYPGEAIGTVILEEKNGKTILHSTMLYESKTARDTVLESKIELGLSLGYSRLVAVLAELT